MSNYVSSRFSVSRGTSIAPRSRSRAPSQALDLGQIGTPPLIPSKRWSSVLEYDTKTRPARYESLPPKPNMLRTKTPQTPSYTDALIKSSQRLRERSMSPLRGTPTVEPEKFSQYKCNMDYYRGKTKSVYEKEPVFQDFVNNIPLSESNLYASDSLTKIKHRFNNMMQDKWGREKTPDPFIPSGPTIGMYEPASEKLAMRHKSVPPTPGPLPFIYVYHRNSRRGL